MTALQTFDLDDFIARRITKRSTSLFAADLAANDAELRSRIEGRTALVIGGAGSIGSQFIKALLEYRPASLVVVDSSENGLTELTRDLRSTADQYIPDDFRTYPVALGTAVFDRLLASEGPFDIVADFAAHKHVRSEKDRFAIEAMLHTNVIDTVAPHGCAARAPAAALLLRLHRQGGQPGERHGRLQEAHGGRGHRLRRADAGEHRPVRERRVLATAACPTDSCAGSRCASRCPRRPTCAATSCRRRRAGSSACSRACSASPATSCSRASTSPPP